MASSYRVDQTYINEVTEIRRNEQRQMDKYMQHTGCLMTFLQSALDDPTPQKCGKCRNCQPDLLLDESYDDNLAHRAAIFLRRSYQLIPPKKQWPLLNMFEVSPFEGYKIPEALRPQEGRALSLWRDAGWGELVAKGKYQAHQFSDDLVSACVEMLKDWKPDPSPKWVTCIPSGHHSKLVSHFAHRLASAIGLPFMPCIEKSPKQQTTKRVGEQLPTGQKSRWSFSYHKILHGG